MQILWKSTHLYNILGDEGLDSTVNVRNVIFKMGYI